MWAVVLACLASNPARAAINIATTIRPLEFIAVAVVGDLGDVTAVMDARDSPHHFTLSPGDRLALADADLILWVGPELEEQLSSFLTRRQQAARSLAVTSLDGVTLHALASGETDPHVWLDPDNARVVAEALAGRLRQLDNANADRYQANLDSFLVQLQQLEIEVGEVLQSARGKPYLVYHDAYQYFEKHFALEHRLTLVDNPEISPGMRAILAKRQQIAAADATCLLQEADASADLITTMTGDDPRLHRLTVDLLGYQVTADSQAYRNLLLGVAGAFRDCLSQSGDQ